MTGSGRGWAWVVLTLALAVHAVDEYASDFAGEYSVAVAAMKAQWSWLPLQPMSPTTQIVLLAAAVAVLLAITPLVVADRKWARLAALNFGGIMAFNGLAHLLFSLSAGAPTAGAWTSPLTLAAAAWLLTVEARACSREPVVR